jgi:hypothetical protein
MATEPDDDDKKRQQAQAQQGFNDAQSPYGQAKTQMQASPYAQATSQMNSSPYSIASNQANVGGSRAQPQAYPFAQTFQAPSEAVAGQRTAMPWNGANPSLQGGGGATPWTQSPYAQAAGQANASPYSVAAGQANMGAPGGMPNWAALAQRFGGGQQLGNASPAFQRPQFGGWGGQGMAGGQANPWLQQLMQGAAQRIAAARAGGGGQWPGMGAQQQGFAMPQWGGGMPQWGGRQY